jgi:hypothetical protein
MVRSTCTAALLTAGICLAPATVQAATITWDGGGDGTNWSDHLNWDANTVGDPGSDDTAQFNNVSSGTLNTTVDAATTVQFLNLNQSTTTATNAISLAADLVLSSNNTATSGITYGSTISNAAMINWDINGNYLQFSTTSSARPCLKTLHRADNHP